MTKLRFRAVDKKIGSKPNKVQVVATLNFCSIDIDIALGQVNAHFFVPFLYRRNRRSTESQSNFDELLRLGIVLNCLLLLRAYGLTLVFYDVIVVLAPFLKRSVHKKIGFSFVFVKHYQKRGILKKLVPTHIKRRVYI
jgi:hypothetical protein